MVIFNSQVRLPSPVTFSMTVRPVCLPSKRDSRQSFTNIPAVVTGWGVTSDRNPDLNDVLQEANVTTISNNECELQFPTVVQELFHYSYNSFFKLKLILKNFWMNLSQNILLPNNETVHEGHKHLYIRRTRKIYM